VLTDCEANRTLLHSTNDTPHQKKKKVWPIQLVIDIIGMILMA